MIDASGSQRDVIDMEMEEGAPFLTHILPIKMRPTSSSFDIAVDLLQDFTRDFHRLQAALNSAKINTGFARRHSGSGRWTASVRGDPRGTLSTTPSISRRTTISPKKSAVKP